MCGSVQASAEGSLFTATMIADTTLVDQAARHTEQRFRDRYSSVWGAPTPPGKVHLLLCALIGPVGCLDGYLSQPRQSLMRVHLEMHLHSTGIAQPNTCGAFIRLPDWL